MTLTQPLTTPTLSRPAGSLRSVPPPEITSPELARQHGYARYWSGRPCKHGHDGLRSLFNQCCYCRKYIRGSKGKAKRRKAAAPSDIIKRWKATRRKYRFDRKAANRVVNFFERRLVHIEGELAGKPFILERWQRKLLRTLFGWYRRFDGTRRFRTLYLEVPRKNGKSALASGLALYLTYVDREPGSRVVAAAADKEQAAIVHGVARKMVQASPSRQVSKRLKVYKQLIVDYETGSTFNVISADATTKHGKNLHGIVLDEVHAQANRELYDVLHTSKSARRQPMEILITTAGYDKNSICWELHEYADKVNTGIVEDDSFLGVIFAAGKEDDWTSPEVWKRANPNLGVSKKWEYMKEECLKAQRTPGYENTFKRLELNIWTEQDSRWLAIDVWDKCKTDGYPLEALAGRECYGGLDLANTIDIAAYVLTFPLGGGRYQLLPFFYVPLDTAAQRERENGVPYETWIRQGLITGTPGNRIDYDFIHRDIVKTAETYNVVEIQFDRWNATQFAGNLENEGLTMIPMSQTFNTLDEPCRYLEKLVAESNLIHMNHPVLRWMARNVAIVQNADGKIRPHKQKSADKIDGVVASIMALDRARRYEDAKSPYEERGLSLI